MSKCLYKEFFGLGMFLMFLVYFYFEVIKGILDKKIDTIKSNKDK